MSRVVYTGQHYKNQRLVSRPPLCVECDYMARTQRSSDEPITIRRSPVVIIYYMIAIQFAMTAFYFLAGIAANYGEIYIRLRFSSLVSYELAKLLLIFAVEFMLIAFVIFRWATSSYVIAYDQFAYEWGILSRRRRTRPLTRPLTVTCTYGFVARLFKYGTLTIRTENLREPIILRHVPAPKLYLRLIMQQEQHARTYAPPAPANIKELLASREHEKLEFKSSLRWDFEKSNINKNLEWVALKTVAAFLNAQGGHLIVGVGDNRDVVGLAHDYQTLKKKDADGFENHFTNIFKEAIGPEYRQFVNLSFHPVGDKEVCLIRANPSVMPAYMKLGNEEVFYVRTGNSTTALQVSEIANYIRSRWE